MTQAPDPLARRTVRTICPMNCHPTYCGMRVELEQDRVVGIKGDHENPDSRGFLCIRGQAAAEIVDNPARVRKPRVRDESGSFHDADWEPTLERIAQRIRHVGALRTAIFTGHGVRGQFSARFANMLGTQWWDPTILCWGLGGFGFHLTGVTEVNTADDMAEHAQLILLWGANLASQPTTTPRIAAARRRGAQVVVIDVRMSEACALADEVFIVRPGSDAALALAMMHVMVRERLYDEAFVQQHTLGFDELVTHLTPYDPEFAAGETGIGAERIAALARRFAASKNSMILAGGSSMHKTGNGWYAGRAIACLPALTGSLGRPGAGMGPRHAAKSHGMGMGRVVPPDVKAPEDVVPAEMSRILEALETGQVKVLLLLGTNMLSSFADAGRLGRALSKLDLVVSFDLFANDTSREYAHILLPGTSWLEEVGFKATNTHLYLMDQVIAPRGEARPSFWLLEQLARRLGCPEFFPWSSVEQAFDVIFAHDAFAHTTVAELRRTNAPQKLAIDPVGHADLRFPTPSGKVELVSERARELGLPALPVPPPPGENSGASSGARVHPLIFVQGRTITHFHSFYDHGQALPTLARVDPRPVLWIHPEDAAARGIVDGASIRLFNQRGEMFAHARVTEATQAGVVWMRDGWRGANHLTSSARTVSDAVARSFPAGAASYEARVDVELAAAR
jgi:anaerobic selenocysteine-containing dehydrogenase